MADNKNDNSLEEDINNEAQNQNNETLNKQKMMEIGRKANSRTELLSDEELDFVMNSPDISEEQKKGVSENENFKRKNVDKFKEEEKQMQEQARKQQQMFSDILKKDRNGEELTKEEKRMLNHYKDSQDKQSIDKTNVFDENTFNDNLYEKKRGRILAEGGKEILQLTDTHCEPKDLEYMIQRWANGGQLEDNQILVHTGDLLMDFIDFEKFGMREEFLAENLIKQAGFTGEKAEEFEELHSEMLKGIGLTQSDLRTGAISDQKQLQQLQMLMFGLTRPQVMTDKERDDFMVKQERFLELMSEGIKNHARGQYGEIREIFEKYNLNRDNFVLVGGNHDVIDVMKEELGEYMMSEGEKRDVKGINFGHGYSGATGSIMGRKLNYLFGSRDITENLQNIKYNTKEFKAVKNILAGEGVKLDDEELDELIRRDIGKAIYGLSSDHIREFSKNIGTSAETEIKNQVKSIKNNVPSGSDVYVHHSWISDPQNAGISDRAYHTALQEELKTNPNLVVMHGHNHGTTTGTYGGIPQLNAGSTRSNNFGRFLFDKNKSYAGTYQVGLDKVRGGINEAHRYQTQDELMGGKDRGGKSMQ
jgi:hypothetical protein